MKRIVIIIIIMTLCSCQQSLQMPEDVSEVNSSVSMLFHRTYPGFSYLKAAHSYINFWKTQKENGEVGYEISRDAWLTWLLNQLDSNLESSEWLIVRLIAAQFPAPMMNNTIEYERSFVYRAHRPSGTIWWSKLNGDNYLIKDGRCYIWHEEGYTLTDIYGIERNYVAFDIRGNLPSDNLWKLCDEYIEPPIIVQDLEPFRQAIALLSIVSVGCNKLCLKILSKTSVNPLYSLSIDALSGRYLYYYSTIGETAWDWYDYQYDVPFRLPNPGP